MEMETMFVEQKWNIIRELSNQPKSPLQLSETLGTSMANVSQQLRLLEAANLVGKQKIKNRDKGKPRALFSLTGDYGYLIAASNGFARKQLVSLDDDKRAIMQIWFVKNDDLHQDLQKLYWDLKPHLADAEGIVLVERDLRADVFIVAKKTSKKKFEEFTQKKNDNIRVVIVGIDEMRAEVAKISGPRTIFVLHDHLDHIGKL